MTRVALAVAAVLAVAMPVRADYPERPILLIVSGEAGSSLDTAARLIAPYLQKHLDFDVPVSVENRDSMAGAEAYRVLAESPADGHVLALAVLPDLVTLPIQGNGGYDPATLTNLGAIGFQPTVIVVPAASPWSSVDDLIAAARDAATPLRFGVTDSGSGTALAARRLFAAPGVGALTNPYTTEAGLRGALASGVVAAAAMGRPTALRLNGEVRALAGDIGEPEALLTIAAPAGLLSEIARSLRDTVRRIAHDKAFAHAAGLRGIVASYLSPDEVAARRQAAEELYGRLWRIDPWIGASDKAGPSRLLK